MSRLVILREPKQKITSESTAPWENPLVPHAMLREMYEKMLRSRLLEEHVLSSQQKTKNATTKSKKRGPDAVKGQEACRAAVVLGLVAGDLVAEAHAGPSMAFLLGAELDRVLGGYGADAVLPFVESARDRLHAALGAAMVFSRDEEPERRRGLREAR